MNLKREGLLLVCLVAILVVGTVVIEEFVGRQSVEKDEYKLRVEKLLEDAIKEVKEIRGLSPPEHVDVEVVTINWTKEHWGRSYAEADKESILREERIYKALFMIPENASLYEAKVEWAGVIVSAVWQGKIYVVREYFNPWGRLNAEKTLVHELTHILQDEYFHVPDVPTYDGEKARSALIEGDACLMEEAYVNRTKEHGYVVEVNNEQHFTTLSEKPQFFECSPSLPDSISRLNYFPYDYGLKFVRALHAKGDWEAVNQAYENLPTTTEQIMHPEKYFAGENAQKVEEPPVKENGWQKMKTERFGEYFILVMLSNWVPENEAKRAAEGWGGDNLTYYEREGDYLLTWNITWDSLEDASEFYLSFQEMMNKTGAKEETENLWQAHGRYLSLTWEGTSTLIVSSTNEDAVEKIVGDPQQTHGCSTASPPTVFTDSVYSAAKRPFSTR